MERKKLELKDYRAPSHEVTSLELWFDLNEDHCLVRQKSSLRQTGNASELFLDGDELECTEVRLNQTSLQLHSNPQLEITPNGMKLSSLPKEFTLEITTKIYPQKNTALEGLYKSGGLYCTQCEAQGFRRITFFQDRPDVMTKYRVHISADKTKYPILLCNGNKIAAKDLGQGRHQVSWEDPFNKPCYLFALVAGDLGVLRDEFITSSGRKVNLEIYSPHGTQDRCAHAMTSLKKAMRWDEERFGREYDLDVFMILAVDDFNMGAMENKGLNIFNSRLIFADSQTATDSDYFHIESVVGHEYFHNWTGNRVTVRDWFHLSLKEGLTVFRDQEFSMDMSSREKVRIDSVSALRDHQFAEDAGPNSHPIRPESCYAVDNFYTSTIYEKGAEVIRMMQTLVGRPGFRKGMDLYFSRHDGQAVIIEDFAKAISDANNENWTQFKRWYSQKGTPKISIQENFSQGTYHLSLKQDINLPLHVPLVFALIGKNGVELPLKSGNGISLNSEGQWILHLTQEQQSWSFPGLEAKPRLSINRQFSAPVILDWQAASQDQAFLMTHDQDNFNRWEMAQQLLVREFKSLLTNANGSLLPEYLQSLDEVIGNSQLPEDYRSTFLNIPNDGYFLQQVPVFSPELFLAAREKMEMSIAVNSEKTLNKLYKDLHGVNLLSTDPGDFGKRELKNSALAFLFHLPKYLALVRKQFVEAKIMTDELSAYAMLAQREDCADEAHAEFHKKWKSESLVLNKWFAVQASSRAKSTFQRVIKLCEHPDFQIKNPNRVYSLLRTFGMNLCRFHDPAADTYTFMADKIIELDKLNPQVATRVASTFNVWKKLEPRQSQKVYAQLQRLERAGLSKNTFEIVSNQLRAN